MDKEKLLKEAEDDANFLFDSKICFWYQEKDERDFYVKALTDKLLEFINEKKGNEKN